MSRGQGGAPMGADPTRFSYTLIMGLVDEGSSVLDLGCGSGELLLRLENDNNCTGRGVDRSEDMVLSCIRKGLSVFQGDLDEGLRDYPSRSYDYVILNQTLQMLHDPMFLLREMSRVGKRVIINFPNFGHYLNRFQLMFLGQMPVNKNIPYSWHNTPNIHFCTRKDFIRLCTELGLRIMGEICLNSHGKTVTMGKNVRASQVCMLLQAVDSGGA